MTKHTPAQWTAMRGSTLSGPAIIIRDGDEVIAEVQNEDAARLITAAPDMLDALHKAFRALCELVPTNPAFAIEVAIVKDAIIKAEGWP